MRLNELPREKWVGARVVYKHNRQDNYSFAMPTLEVIKAPKDSKVVTVKLCISIKERMQHAIRHFKPIDLEVVEDAL